MSGDTPRFESSTIEAAVDGNGYWVSPQVIDAITCAKIAALYDAEEKTFRSTVTMARHGFGRGEYKYFARPLPEIVVRLRTTLYAQLAPVANEWNTKYGKDPEWPPDHRSLIARCAAAGQARPTPLLLSYGAGDYNCLHQDLYGEIHFPLQAIVLLDRPLMDFDGGELLLVEQRPRRQSVARVVPLTQGSIAVIPVKERPIRSIRGTARVRVRHGVSPVHRGFRRTLGLIFHDAV